MILEHIIELENEEGTNKSTDSMGAETSLNEVMKAKVRAT